MRNGILVHVSQVERGLACNCVCPDCQNRVKARKGEIYAAHFSHLDGESCANCSGLETWLHIFAKNIIAESGYLIVPDVVVRKGELAERFPGGPLRFDRIELEAWVGRIRPDIVAYVGADRYFIEIAVTHRASDRKKAKVTSMDTNTLEIRIAREGIFSNEDGVLQRAILDEIENKVWLHHRETANLSRRLQARVNEAARKVRINELPRKAAVSMPIQSREPSSPRPGHFPNSAHYLDKAAYHAAVKSFLDSCDNIPEEQKANILLSIGVR